MDDIRTFEKGMIPQVTQTKSPQGSYLEAHNLMRDEAGTIMSEDGIEIVDTLDDGYEIVGNHVLNGQVILAYTNNVDSKIGTIDPGNKVAEIVSHQSLGFKKGKYLSITGRLNSESERVIYLCGEGLPVRSINLDNLPSSSDFDNQTNLFYEYKLPKVKLSSLSRGGSLPSGIYQFTARLVSEDGSSTPFGPLSNIIPVGVGDLSGDADKYTGAPPQTPTNFKIDLNLESVDRSFKYVEVAVVTYLGVSNQPTINLLERVAVDKGSISYTATSEHEGTVLLEEVAVNGIFYSEAKTLLQKDNTLLLCGVKEQEDSFDWRLVANSIEIGYVEKELPIVDSINISGTTGIDEGHLQTHDYRYPEMGKYVGYRRDEVYSFTFTPIFSGGRKGNSYHIPAKINPSIANGLHVAYSTDEYPKDYPGESGKVRYHRFPNDSESPIYRVSGVKDVMVALGIHVNITYPLGDWNKQLIGYEIGRENRRGNETILTQGILKNTYKTGSTNNNDVVVPGLGSMYITGMEVDFDPKSSPIENKCTFHSPDHIANEELTATPSSVRLASTQAIMLGWVNGNQWRGYRGKSFWWTKPKRSDSISPTKNEAQLTGRVVYIPSGSKSPTDDPIENEDNFLTPFFDTNLNYKRILSCVGLEFSEEPPRTLQTIDRFYDLDNSDESAYNTQLSVSTPSDRSISIFNLVVERDRLYGSVYDKIAIPVSTVYFGTPKNDLDHRILPINETIAFGGDTYINRVAYTFRDTSKIDKVASRQNTAHVDSIIYFVMESDNNFALRHSSTEDGSVPFYPGTKNITSTQNQDGLLDLFVSLNHASGYNKQYSAQNNLKTTSSKGIDEFTLTNFPNRIVYSNISIEGELADAYRIFLPNNYHDIPKHFGEVTSAFVLGNDLFVHTKDSLFRSFYNTLAVQSTSAGDVVLGNGGAFNRPSVPVVSIEGGYAGCLNPEASINSPLGRFFYDEGRSKLYLFNGQLKEISNPNLFNKLRELPKPGKSYTYYDYGRKRLLLNTGNITVSYKPELNSFDSYHDYVFSGGCGLDIKDFLFKGRNIGLFSKKLYGSAFGNKVIGSLKIPSVVNLSFKRYRSVKVLMNSFTPEGIHKPFWFFDRMRGYSYERNTDVNGFKVIGNKFNDNLFEFGTLAVERAGGEFRFGFPPDAVMDMSKDIFDSSNLIQKGSTDTLFLADFQDNHCVLDLFLDYPENVRSRIELIKISFDYEED